MATTLDKTTSYAGKAAKDLIRRTFFGAETLLNGWVTVRENVSKPRVIRRLSSSGLIQDKSCDFSPTGTVVIDERLLDPADLETDIEMCKDEFKGDWDEDTMGSGATNKVLPKVIVDAMIAEIQETMGEAIEVMIYLGDTSGTDQFDGYVTIALADGDVTKTIGTIDADGFSADPLRELKLMRTKAIADKTWKKKDFQFIMSSENAAAYQDALTSVGSGQENVSEEAPLRYKGKPIRMTDGIDDIHIMFGRSSNLEFGTDLLSDLNQVVFKDMSDTDLSDNVRFKQVMTGGVQYGFSEEFGLYVAQLS